MVSFSCDRCQDVVKKPKVENHLRHCRSQSVSCVDCSQVFDAGSVKQHTSCFTESQKYEDGIGKPGAKANGGEKRTNGPGFCHTCNLALNGAVMAEMHYQSKKHKAAERREKAAERQKKEGEQNGKNSGRKENSEPPLHDANCAARGDSMGKAGKEESQDDAPQTIKGQNNSDIPSNESVKRSRRAAEKGNAKSRSSSGSTVEKQRSIATVESAAPVDRKSAAKLPRKKKLSPVVRRIIAKKEDGRMKLHKLAKAVRSTLKKEAAADGEEISPMKTKRIVKRIRTLSDSRPWLSIDADEVVSLRA